MYTFNFNCRDGLGKLQNLSENPSLEASACQEDQLKVTRMRIRMRIRMMIMRRIRMMMRMRIRMMMLRMMIVRRGRKMPIMTIK